MKLGAEFYHVR